MRASVVLETPFIVLMASFCFLMPTQIPQRNSNRGVNPSPGSKPGRKRGRRGRRARKAAQENTLVAKGRAQAKRNTFALVSTLKRERKITNSNVEDIALSLMLPREFPPLRYPIQAGAGQRTALARLINRSSTLCRNDYAASPEPARWGWAVFRSPTFPVWEFYYMATAPSGGSLWSTRYTVKSGGGSGQTVALIRLQYTSFDVLSRSTSVSLPFDPPIGLLDANTRGEQSSLMYVPSACSLTFTNSGAATGGATYLNINYLIFATANSNPVPGTARVAINSSVTVSPPAYGWLLLDEVGNEAGTGDVGTIAISVTYGAYPAVFLYPSFPPIELSNSQLLYNDSRVNASSLLISNTTPYISLGGVIRAARFPMTVANAWDLSYLTTKVMATSADLTYSGKADKGVYTWTLPDEYSNKYTDYTTLTSTTTPVFLLSDCAMVNYMQFDGGVISQNSATGAAVQTFALEYTQSIEFKTAAQFMKIDVSRILPDEMSAATMAAGDRPPFVENPLHWATLVSAVRKIGQWVYPTVRPYVIDAYDRGTRYIRDKL